MKTDTTEAAPDAKTAFCAEGLRLLEIAGADAHAPVLDELDELEDTGGLPEESDESPLARGPLGHDADPFARLLPPHAYSAAVWESPCARAVW